MLTQLITWFRMKVWWWTHEEPPEPMPPPITHYRLTEPKLKWIVDTPPPPIDPRPSVHPVRRVSNKDKKKRGWLVD